MKNFASFSVLLHFISTCGELKLITVTAFVLSFVPPFYAFLLLLLSVFLCLSAVHFVVSRFNTKIHHQIEWDTQIILMIQIFLNDSLIGSRIF